MRFITLFFLIYTIAVAKTPYELGKELYMGKGCFSCHGNKADGLHNYPALANRAKGYLTYKLEKFRSRKSDNQQQEMMVGYAIGLSDKDIDYLTTFFAEYKDDESAESYDDSYQEHGDGGS